jgi:hypothetical protein
MNDTPSAAIGQAITGVPSKNSNYKCRRISSLKNTHSRRFGHVAIRQREALFHTSLWAGAARPWASHDFFK